MGHAPESPWNWRDGILRSRAADGTIKVDYINDERTPTLFHHAELDEGFLPGTPVQVHERFCLLASGRRALSVVVLDGLGEVPEPANWEWAETDYISGVADWATGEGILIRRSGSEMD